MQVVETIGHLQQLLLEERLKGRSIGFVPTMGALHAGHLSLVEKARKDSRTSVVSIFVNELQFDDANDFGRYPRSLGQDLESLSQNGVDYVFTPTSSEMLPKAQSVFLAVHGPLTTSLEGVRRPSYFGGMATIVSKLFWAVGRCSAYFGEKDYQQLLVIQRLVEELFVGVQVVGCETVREPDGLAMSSRNQRLSQQDRRAATVLYKALLRGQQAVQEGQTDTRRIEKEMVEVVKSEPSVSLDYAVAVDPVHLATSVEIPGEVRLLIAGSVGGVRLIDNMKASAVVHKEPVIGSQSGKLGGY